MKIFCTAVIAMLCATSVLARPPGQEAPVRLAIQSFYGAFNSHGFEHAADYTTQDWNHINPGGGRTRGRDAVLKELHEVHATFLKGVSDHIEEMDVRFAAPDVAIATVRSRMSTFTMPDGVQHVNEGHIRTFVLVRRGKRWLIKQDQNTAIGG